MLDGTQLHFFKKAAEPTPIFGRVYCAQTTGWIKMPLGMEPRPRPHCARWGPSSPSPRKGAQPPHFRPMSSVPKRLDGSICPWYGGRPRPIHIVLDGNLLPFPEWGTAPIFGECLLWPNGWMDQDATWYKDRPRPRPHCVIWGPSSPPIRGTAPKFLAHVYCGQTVAHLSYC